ncbi:hypothetical protein E3N88_13221 [Mikania micrantha]|uniref:Membrin n=1 Tax=Mikania micrantha TaxID=192012 RepID=A0A5N6P9K4_9ASTR|nr:hypothetical protein E3N88_13221 [Mikania micrantha]
MAVEGGGTLSELYQRSRRLLLKTRDDLERLERLAVTVDSPELSASVRRDISQIQTLCSDMDAIWRSIASKPQRDLWKRKVEQVAEEADSLRESLDRYMQRQQRRMQEAQERAELLGRSVCDLRIFSWGMFEKLGSCSFQGRVLGILPSNVQCRDLNAFLDFSKIPPLPRLPKAWHFFKGKKPALARTGTLFVKVHKKIPSSHHYTS